MKLELKDIVGYLPYGLYFQSSKHQFKYGIFAIFKCTGFTSSDKNLDLEFLYEDDLIFSGKLKPVYPILYPIESLTKEITVNGESFVPIEWIEFNLYTLDIHEQCKSILKNIDWVNQCSHLLVIYLNEWKIDYRGLIKKGLAIDVTTLEVNPYK